jgi:cytochrome b6-f complex iron-sulfur subunit
VGYPVPLCDDLAVTTSPEELSRRKALGLIGSTAICVAGLGTGLTGISFLSPNVLLEPSPLLALTKLSSLRAGAFAPFPGQKVYLRRTAAGIYAMSAVCTHLGCMTRFQARLGRIECPCHGSIFDLEGRVVKGPAPRPLARYKVRIDAEELVVVDTSLTVGPDEKVRV